MDLDLSQLILTSCIGTALALSVVFVILLVLEDIREAVIKLIEALASRINK